MAKTFRQQALGLGVSFWKTSGGKKEHTTSHIARLFQDYYGSLYNILRGEEDLTVQERQQKISQYLKEINFPRLKAISARVTAEEFLKVVKGLENGKSQGPDGLTKAYYLKYAVILL